MVLPQRVTARAKRAARLVRLTLLSGQSVECLCCGGSWRRMDSHRGRPGARCPRCDALERHRILWLFLQRETDLLEAPHRVLHLAPEPVIADLIRNRPNLSYISGDLNPGAAMEVMDVTELPRPDGAFDVVLCNHVLEHIPDDRRAMSELFRVLEPGGRPPPGVWPGGPRSLVRPRFRGAAARGRVRGGRPPLRRRARCGRPSEIRRCRARR